MNLNLSSLKIRRLPLLAAVAAFGMVSAPAQTTNQIKPRDFEAFKIITERNIFDANRRPVVRGVPRPVAPPVDAFFLTGTMSYENGPFAVFDGSSSEYHKVLSPGGKIAVYTVVQITHDFVKLSFGTNEVELKVGMQCRRSEDGKWSTAEGGDSAIAFNSGSRNRTFNRGDRSERRNGFRNDSRSSGASRIESNTGGQPAGGSGEAGASPGTGNFDPNDVVARMMAARAAQVGGNPGPDDGGGPPPDPNAPGGTPNEPTDGANDNSTPPPASPAGNPNRTP